MSQFVIYLICGFCEVWVILFMWGFSNGPVNAIPYFALIGCLLLLIVSAPSALFLHRIAASVAIVGAAFVLPWPVFIFLREHSPAAGAFLGLAPMLAGIIAVHHLWRTRTQKWLALLSSPRLWVRVSLSLAAFAVFVLSFNARLVAQILLGGPRQ